MNDVTLSSALARATRALDADDAIEAALALRAASDACEAALRHGLVPAPAALRTLHARCCAAAEHARRRLAEAIGAAGGARRATTAYRR